MSGYFPEPKLFGGKVKVEIDLLNYATKTEVKNATGIDTSSFAKKVDSADLKSNADNLDIDKLKNVPYNLSNLKSKVDKLHVDKLLPAPADLSKVSDAVKNDVVKKDVFNVKIKNIKDKIPEINNLATEITFHAKINEFKGEIPNITKTALNAVEKKTYY